MAKTLCLIGGKTIWTCVRYALRLVAFFFLFVGALLRMAGTRH